MFGSEYYKHPEILLDSFKDISHEYSEKSSAKQSQIIIILEKIYLAIFGIPEIGFQVRGRYFKNFIKKIEIKPERILDAGSGIGSYSFWLSKRYPHATIDGIDIDKHKLKFTTKFAKEQGIKNTHFKFGDVTSISEKNKYDLVVNVDVLEHVANYEKVLKNFYNTLSPNGYLFIHTPQANQKRIFKALEHWHHEGHVHEGFSPATLKKDLKQLGFEIVEMKETFGFFGKLAWELNHLLLSKGFVLVGLLYPLLYLISLLDNVIVVKRGLGTAVLARK